MRQILFILAITMISCSQQESQSFIQTIDTDFSKGRLSLLHQVHLEDLEKFHGHLCDGLVVGYQALDLALQVLYPDGNIDRTNTRIASKASPCLTDAAIYLTGGRYQFNTFYVSDSIEGMFIVQRIDDGKAVSVKMNKGVKPNEINVLGKLAVEGDLPACDLDKLKRLEDKFSDYLLNSDPSDNFSIAMLDGFQWNPILRNDFVKTDILNKAKSKCN